MKEKFPMEAAIYNRTSVRTYEGKELSPQIIEKLEQYNKEITNPFQVPVNIKIIQGNTGAQPEKLGTYGMIKGARYFLVITVPDVEFAMEAVGYVVEELVLYATHLGLGTCWLGGTFKREEFIQKITLEEGHLFPIVVPIGYGVKMRLMESLVRKAAKANQRKEWEELFFENNFSMPVKKQEGNLYHNLLELVRLAPSASNKQPWRILVQGDIFHFYEEKTPGYAAKMTYDIQKIDLGIAGCHFQLAGEEKGIFGKIQKLNPPEVTMPEHTHYRFSWVKEEK